MEHARPLQPQPDSLKDQLIQEAEAMAKYAYANGLKVPLFLANLLEKWMEHRSNGVQNGESSLTGKPLKELAYLHERLGQIVAPAKPRTILLLANEAAKPGLLRKLGPLPLVRQMMMVSVLFAVAFIGLSLSALVNEESITKTVLTGEGLPLLLCTLFLMAAAGLGASFSALFKANRFIVEGTFDPKHESSYWIKLVLGLSAGLMLAELVPFEQNGSLPVLAKPTLAMLGGFSADVVYRILSRLSDSIGSFVRGDPKDLVSVRLKSSQIELEERIARHRLEFANALMTLQQHLTGGAGVDEAKRQVDGLLSRYLPQADDGEAAILAQDALEGINRNGREAVTRVSPSASSDDVASRNSQR